MPCKRITTKFLIINTLHKHGIVAQLGERLPCTQDVESSSLFSSTIGYVEQLAAHLVVTQTLKNIVGSNPTISTTNNYKENKMLQALLLKFIKGYVLNLLLDRVVDKMKKEVHRTENNVDDQVVEIVEDYIRDSLS